MDLDPVIEQTARHTNSSTIHKPKFRAEGITYIKERCAISAKERMHYAVAVWVYRGPFCSDHGLLQNRSHISFSKLFRLILLYYLVVKNK